MNVQSFKPQQNLPKFGLPAKSGEEAPKTDDVQPASRPRSNSKDTFEVVGSAVATGLMCGLSANGLGAGWGSLASVAGSTVGWGAVTYATSQKDGYEGLKCLAGGVAGLVMGAVGATGAAVGSLVGHPVVGGLVAGSLMGAYGAIKQN